MNKNSSFEQLNIPHNHFCSIRSAKRDNKSTWTIPQHYNSYEEIIVYKKINGALYLSNSTYTLQSPSLLYIPRYVVHGFDVNVGTHDYFIIHINLSQLPNNLATIQFPSNPIYHSINFQDFSFLCELLSFTTQAKDQLEHKAIELLLLLLEKKMDDYSPIHSISIAPHHSRFIPLLKYLDSHAIFSLTAEEAASICNMSKSHFFKLFKLHFNMCFTEFLTQRQINQAKYLLKNTNISITEVAYTLQFCDASYFGKVFKLYTGMAPLSYRNKQSND